MFGVTRYPMISKTESGRVGYRKKYRVAGRVRVPAGHWTLDKTGFFFFPPISTPQVDVREPSDGQWGAQMENGSWSGVVEMTNSSNTFVDLHFVFGFLFLPMLYVCPLPVSQLMGLGGSSRKERGQGGPLHEPGANDGEGNGHRLLSPLLRFGFSIFSSTSSIFSSTSSIF